MSARDSILARIRERRLEPQPLPDLFQQGIRFDDPLRQFAESVKFVGGEVVELADRAALEPAVRELDIVRSATTIASLVPDLPVGTFDMAQTADPHELAGVDVAIVPGEFGVAENGAVWVRGESLVHRAICFLTQRLVLVVPRGQLVHNMHEAYARLSFDRSGYGVFISGPSKTADIEQSLVIGAHGARSLVVYFA